MSTIGIYSSLMPAKGVLGMDSTLTGAEAAPDTADDLLDTLLFFCAWEHSTRQFGNKAPLLLRYFLSDGSIELRQLPQSVIAKHAFAADLSDHNERNPFPPAVKRMRVPKQHYHSMNKATSGGSRPLRPDEGFYGWRDLAVGRAITVLGRKLLILEADAATQEFYTERGVAHETMAPIQVEALRMPTAAHMNDPASPYKAMNPRAAALHKSVSINRSSKHMTTMAGGTARPGMLRSNTMKATAFDGKPAVSAALRFKASMAPAPGFRCNAADLTRSFIVSFYLADGTMAIAEPPNKATRTGGPEFLARQMVLKPDDDDPYRLTRSYREDDFYVGALVTLLLPLRPGYEAEGPKALRLAEADSWTLDYMEARPHTFPMADWTCVSAGLARELRLEGRAARLVAELAKADAGGQRFVYRKQLHEVLVKIGCDVTMHDVITLTRRLDPDGVGVDQGVLADEFSLPTWQELDPAVLSRRTLVPVTARKDPATEQAAALRTSLPIKGSKYGNTGHFTTAYGADFCGSETFSIGAHTFGADPWSNPYYNRREHGTHLIKEALSQRSTQIH